MRTSRRVATALGLAAGLALAPAGAALSSVAATADTQTCPVPVLGLDPDSVTLSGLSTTMPATADVTAAETPGEMGPGAPTVRLFVYRQNGSNMIMDLLNGLRGPSTSGGASLSGPATGKGAATETITFSAPGTYTFGFIALFDNGIHPCASLLPTNHALTITVP